MLKLFLLNKDKTECLGKPCAGCQLPVCLLCCPSLCRTRIWNVPKRTYHTLHIHLVFLVPTHTQGTIHTQETQLQLKSDPPAESLVTWQMFRPPSFRMLEHKMFFRLKLVCVFTVQRAVSLFSLSEPHVGGAELRPVISPVAFHTPQTPRATPTFNR